MSANYEVETTHIGTCHSATTFTLRSGHRQTGQVILSGLNAKGCLPQAALPELECYTHVVVRVKGPDGVLTSPGSLGLDLYNNYWLQPEGYYGLAASLVPLDEALDLVSQLTFHLAK